MKLDPGMAEWPRYQVESTLDVDVLANYVDAIWAAFERHPSLAFIRMPSTRTFEFTTSPAVSPMDAKEAALDMLDAMLPGIWDRTVNYVERVVTEVVAPTAQGVGSTVTQAAAVGSDTARWLVVGAVAVAVIYVLWVAR